MNVQAILDQKGSEVATMPATATLADAAARLRAEGIGAVVVSSDGARVEGILSERDVVRAVAEEGSAALERTVASAMTADVVTCARTDSVDALMRAMTDRRIRHLPVVEEGTTLAGIVSIGDVVKRRLFDLESEKRQLENYIAGG